MRYWGDKVGKVKYRITEEHCSKMIFGVCSCCGGKIEPIETVDNSGNPTFWGGCKKCSVFDWGVRKTVWRVARTLVESNTVIPYPHLQENEYTLLKDYIDAQTSGAVDIVRKVLVEYKKEIK